ncbi:MAG TPA: AtpZ/AtpI family protein [Candidatus Binatia bacterium]|nr:AtpZ/AtpI family protein [Candidatus Binatia bacterium]
MGKSGGRPSRQQDRPNPLLRKAGLYLAIGLELPGAVLAGLLVGYFLDDYLGTSPWLLIALTAVAFTGAIVRLLHWVRFLARERDAVGSEKNHHSY